jgi:hypothetical protein
LFTAFAADAKCAICNAFERGFDLVENFHIRGVPADIDITLLGNPVYLLRRRQRVNQAMVSKAAHNLLLLTQQQ